MPSQSEFYRASIAAFFAWADGQGLTNADLSAAYIAEGNRGNPDYVAQLRSASSKESRAFLNWAEGYQARFAPTNTAPAHLGSYKRADHAHLIGRYQLVRPNWLRKDVITANDLALIDEEVHALARVLL